VSGGARALPLLLLAATATALVGGCQLRSSEPERIVLIVVDTLRRDHVSAYGGPARTPAIDRLAARGQVYTNAVASFHQTSMSMGALFSGRTPSIESGDFAQPLHWNGRNWCGLARLAPAPSEPGGAAVTEPCVPRNVPTLAETMRAKGYRTVGVVSNEFLYRPAGFDRGFDEWIEVAPAPMGDPAQEGMAAKRMRAAPFVNQAVAAVLDRQPAGRLFLYVHFMDAHDWDLHGAYDKAVRIADNGVGFLVSALERRGLLESAVVVLTADHGEALGERHGALTARGHVGNPSFEQVLQIPLIVAPALAGDPERFLRSEDVFRLLADVAGAPAEAASELEPGELYLSETHYQTYRDEQFKSTRRRQDGALQLFDLARDPAESADVAIKNPEVVQRHAKRMGQLGRALAAAGMRATTLSPEDAARLKALGYAQ
jgi:hypothetical protein